jgi:hypothetical protein
MVFVPEGRSKALSVPEIICRRNGAHAFSETLGTPAEKPASDDVRPSDGASPYRETWALQRLIRYASLSFQMVAHKLWVYVFLLLCLGRPFAAQGADFQGIPLPENSSIVLAVAAEGVQIYEAKQNAAGTYEWALKAPEAELKSLSGEVLGKHYGGPSWSLHDGSQLVGSMPPVKAVSAPEAGNIPWLLVAPKTKSETGLLSKIDYVIRFATVGGVAPAEPPKSSTDIARVNYRAIYLFLRKQ